MSNGPSLRVLKVQKEVSQLIGEYLQKSWKGYKPTIVSVRSVDVHADMRSARVYLSLLQASEEQVEDFKQDLNDQAGQIQKFVSQSLKMKFSPRLSFVVGSESL